MDLKKLYTDVTVILGKELSIYKFLTLCDMGAKAIIGRYPKKFTLCGSEYISPETLSSSFALCDAFYISLLYYVIAAENADENMYKKSKDAAEDAYLTLWRKSAAGKRIANDIW